MKFVDFNGSISNDTLLQLSGMEQIDTPAKGKESIATLQHGRVFVFTPTEENNYCVRYQRGVGGFFGKFHNGVCRTEDEVMKIIVDLKKAELGRMGPAIEPVLQEAQYRYGLYKKPRTK